MALVLVVSLVISLGSVVTADEFSSKNKDIVNPEVYTPMAPKKTTDEKALADIATGEPNYENTQTYGSILSMVTVEISEPCDQAWRAAYTSWMYEANRIIERVDDYLGSEFSIDFLSISQKEWDSTDVTNPTTDNLFYDAKSEWGLSGADLMIAFSDRSNDYAGRVLAIPSSYAIISIDQGYTDNVINTEHEVGHLYGLYHCTNTSCFMKQGNYIIDSLCSTHHTEWNNNRLEH